MALSYDELCSRLLYEEREEDYLLFVSELLQSDASDADKLKTLSTVNDIRIAFVDDKQRFGLELALTMLREKVPFDDEDAREAVIQRCLNDDAGGCSCTEKHEAEVEAGEDEVAVETKSPGGPQVVLMMTDNYNQFTLEGFEVLVNKRVDSSTSKDALSLLGEHVREVRELWGEERVNKLLEVPVRFWVEVEKKDSTAAEYHPSRCWLRQNGYNISKEKAIEICNVKHFLSWANREKGPQPMMILHELSHAYHDIALTQEDDFAIQQVYDNAVGSGKYVLVDYLCPGGPRKSAYAITNHREFFAETCESFFGRNDYEPFNREQLSTFDPKAFALMQRVWGDNPPQAKCGLEPLKKANQTRSKEAKVSVTLEVRNTSGRTMELVWIDYNGEIVPLAELRPGTSVMQNTFATHVFALRYVGKSASKGTALVYTVTKRPKQVMKI